jgi:uncharacterized phage protein (TIGR02218 family)
MLDADSTYAAFHAELRKPNAGVCLCWRVVRLDGTTYYFTDHDAELTAGGFTFTPLDSGSGLARKQTEGLAVDNQTLIGLIDDGNTPIGVTEADVLGSIFADAAVTVWLCIWTNVSAGLLPLSEGTIGPMTFRTVTFEAEIRGIAERLNKRVYRTYNLTCDAVLGDSRCGVSFTGSPSTFQFSASILAAPDRRGMFVSDTGQADNWFQYGLVEFTSGANNGLKREIVNHIGAGSPLSDNVLALYPFPFDISVGDTVTLTAGCDKRAATCSGKFSNLVNFRGFNLIPTQETILETPDAK